jgi:hypothetical protein
MIKATRMALTAASLAGAALWLAASLLTSKREAWDSSWYWALAYPLSIAACALLGYRFTAQPWRWVLALFAAQFAAMCLLNGEVGNLWPLGILLFSVLALPAVLAAQVAGHFGRLAAASKS